MILKKTLATILALASLAAQGAVFAEDDIMLISENPVAVTEPLAVEYDKIEQYGTAKVEEDGLYIIDQAEISEVFLNTDANTIFVDSMGYKTSMEAIENGASLKVIASNAMTMSIPPQTYAHVVMLADENGGFPIFAEVEKIITDDSGNLVFSSKDGKYDIVYGEGMTQVEPFATRNIVTTADIKENSRILVFADIMTMSLPALVPANRIVILPDAVEITEEAVIESVTVNGTEFNFIERDSVLFLPVRATCESAGLTVQWDDTLKAVTVGTVPMGVTFNSGVNSYTKARMMPQTLSAEPITEGDRIYVPVDFFTEILGGTASNEDGTLSIAL